MHADTRSHLADSCTKCQLVAKFHTLTSSYTDIASQSHKHTNSPSITPGTLDHTPPCPAPPGKTSLSTAATPPGLTFRGRRRQRPRPRPLPRPLTPSRPGPPQWGRLHPGANGRREVKLGGLPAHWSLQLPITSTPTSAGHFLSRPGIEEDVDD